MLEFYCEYLMILGLKSSKPKIKGYILYYWKMLWFKLIYYRAFKKDVIAKRLHDGDLHFFLCDFVRFLAVINGQDLSSIYNIDMKINNITVKKITGNGVCIKLLDDDIYVDMKFDYTNDSKDISLIIHDNLARLKYKCIYIDINSGIVNLHNNALLATKVDVILLLIYDRLSKSFIDIFDSVINKK